MPEPRVDLHARQPDDLEILRRILDALRKRGTEAVLSVDAHWPEPPPGTQHGPVACEVRLVQVGPGSATPPKDARLVVLEAEIGSPGEQESPHEFAGADLVLVAGPARAKDLSRCLRVPVVACGLPRLDSVLADPREARRDARRRLDLPESAEVVALAPTTGPRPSRLASFGEGVLAVTGNGAVVLIPGEGSSARRLAPADWSARFEALAPHCPGVTLAGPLGREFILAAADRVVGDPGALTLEAIALGVPTVLLEDPESVSPVPKGVALRASTLAELCSAVRAPLEPGAPGLLGAPRSHWAQELLCREQGSAERVADQILTLLSDAPRGASRPGNREGASPNPNDPKAVSVPPPDDSDEALYLELEARVGFGECSGAIERLRAHLGRRPSAEGYRRLASFYRRAEQPDPACEAAAQAERLARDELARTLCERGRTEVDRGRTEDARTLFEEAQHLAPHLVDPWLGVGSLKLAGGAHAFAEEAFQRAVERDPKSVPAWTGLGLALLGEGRANESLDVFEQALDLEPRALPAIFGLVQAAFRVGALARAERRVRACLEVRSGNLDLAFTLAGLRTQLGDPSGAREMLDRIELFRPDYPGLAELRAKLEGN